MPLSVFGLRPHAPPLSLELIPHWTEELQWAPARRMKRTIILFSLSSNLKTVWHVSSLARVQCNARRFDAHYTSNGLVTALVAHCDAELLGELLV